MNDNLLIEKLKKTNVFTDSEVDEIFRCFEEEKLSKNQLFTEAKTRCNKIGFLEDGILCSYIYDAHGEEVVKHFIQPGQFFTDIESYENQQPGTLNIKAVVDSSILIISRKSDQKLLLKHPGWEFIMKSFAADALQQMVQMQNFLHFGSAVDKYNHFLENHPKLVRQLPLKYIASYLGITQSSLSRIRRENLK